MVALQLPLLGSFRSSPQGKGTRRCPVGACTSQASSLGPSINDWCSGFKNNCPGMQVACFSSLYITSSQPVAEGSHSGEGRSQHRLPLQRVSSRGWVWGFQKENKSPWRTPGATKGLPRLNGQGKGYKAPPAYPSTSTCSGHGPHFPPSAAGSWGHSPVPTWFLFPTNPCLYYGDTASQLGLTPVTGITTSTHFPPWP